MKTVSFYAPGAKFYENEFHKNNRKKFRSVSVSGNECLLKCPHCNGKMLENMLAAQTPKKLLSLCDELAKEGCEGILLSGGCDKTAAVDLSPFCEVLSSITKKMKVAAHSGFASNETLLNLKNAGVSTVFFDVIGSSQTAKKVLGIDAGAEEYAKKLLYMKEIGLKCAPHIVIGMDYGKIVGEYDALEAVAKNCPERLVLVVLKPLHGTKMEEVSPPPIDEVIGFFEYARKKMPQAEISLGCARPAGEYSLMLEKKALELGFSKIAYPAAQTIKYAYDTGFDVRFCDNCCAL